MTDRINPDRGDRPRVSGQTVVTVIASFVATVSLTYAITTAGMPRKIEKVEDRTTQLEIGQGKILSTLESIETAIGEVKDAVKDK